MKDTTLKSIEEQKKEKEMVTSDYTCSRNCRLCPFPGAKCVENPEYYWTHIK